MRLKLGRVEGHKGRGRLILAFHVSRTYQKVAGFLALGDYGNTSMKGGSYISNF